MYASSQVSFALITHTDSVLVESSSTINSSTNLENNTGSGPRYPRFELSPSHASSKFAHSSLGDSAETSASFVYPPVPYDPRLPSPRVYEHELAKSGLRTALATIRRTIRVKANLKPALHFGSWLQSLRSHDHPTQSSNGTGDTQDPPRNSWHGSVRFKR